MITNYKDLHVWKDGMTLVGSIYALTQRLPSDEKYGLMSQMRRAAVSIPSNIAEGSRRNSNKDFVHFLAIASGSAAELETQVMICAQLGYQNEASLTEPLDLIDKIIKSLHKLQKARS